MAELTEAARTILRHFKNAGLKQREYEYPATLEALFDAPQKCEQAQAELADRGLIDLGRAPPSHIPVASRVVAAALTLDGERFIASNEL